MFIIYTLYKRMVRGEFNMIGNFKLPWWVFVVIMILLIPALPFFILKWICELIVKACEWIIDLWGYVISHIFD